MLHRAELRPRPHRRLAAGHPNSGLRRGLSKKRVNGFEPSTFTLATCAGARRKQMHDSGLETPDKGEPAESAAAALPDGPDADLRAVIESWHTLPQHIRETIQTLVESSPKETRRG